MLDLKQMKKLLDDPSLPDDQVLEIRDQMYALAEIIYEKWDQDRKKEREKNSKKDFDTEKLPDSEFK